MYWRWIWTDIKGMFIPGGRPDLFLVVLVITGCYFSLYALMMAVILMGVLAVLFGHRSLQKNLTINDKKTAEEILAYMINRFEESRIIEWIEVNHCTPKDLNITKISQSLSELPTLYAYIIEHDLFMAEAGPKILKNMIQYYITDAQLALFRMLCRKTPLEKHVLRDLVSEAVMRTNCTLIRELLELCVSKTSDQWLRAALFSRSHDVVDLLLTYYDDPAKVLRRLKTNDMKFHTLKGRQFIHDTYARAFKPYRRTEQRALPVDTTCLVTRDVIASGAIYMLCTNTYVQHPILYEHVLKLAKPEKCIVCSKRMCHILYINE